ncbi:hypothetical protein RGQ29_012749 [Quercus rubra]|uniref:RNA helicase n=1 Tax=Quercus rubra TaxID=3512 RepID=A0AAN7G7V2_QUERU|nr:hypothetical protein RGQ29_012749 [Quercus rubra]
MYYTTTTMTWSDGVTESTQRPQTRPTQLPYVPPHLRNKYNNGAMSSMPTSLNDDYANKNANSYGFTTESTQPPLGRGGRGHRGRGGGGGRGGRGRFHQTQEQDSYNIASKFEKLEVNVDDESPESTNFAAYDDIPVEVSGSEIPSPASSFEEIDLGESLNRNIKRCKYVKPTPIQRHAIPIALAGRDLMACAQTGSGKTAAFCFPIIHAILELNRLSKPGRVAFPLALILSPTRELACQIYEEAKKFAYQTRVRVAVAYGGAPIVHQLHNLEKGVDILVATPGRLVDMMERAKVSLSMIKCLALDEADRMLDMGFEPQIRKIVQQMDMPPCGSRQTMFFSATFPDEIQRLASDFLSNYIFLSVGRVGSSTDLIAQRVEFVPNMDKRNHLMNLLRGQEPNGTHGKHALTLIFVETKRGADALEHWLSLNGFPAIAIHGDKVQMERERALKSFKSGYTPILVATDVASRGLDVPHVAHVINFDLPKDIDDYVHRIGRTGRAGKSGLATAFFSDQNMPLAKALVELLQEANQEVPLWLNDYAKRASNIVGGGRARRFGGSKFGGYDFRRDAQYEIENDPYSSTYGSFDGTASSYGLSNANSYAATGVDSYSTGSYGHEFSHETVEASGWD